ncbi:MAG: ATP-binding protein [bacterium]
MKLIKRLVQKQIEESCFKGKVVVIYGPRQVGKTTLAKQILANYGSDGLYLNCEILSVNQALARPEPAALKSYFGNHKLVVLDEAQKIPDIGRVLKVFVDTYPQIQILATGSSSFDLANITAEPLTGRVNEFILYPLSFQEIEIERGRPDAEAKLEQLLRTGAYPEVFLLPESEAIQRLNQIASNYLYKDVLAFDKIKKSNLLVNLLQLLALQLGQEVSYQELAKSLGVSRLTVQKYINLLEQSFVIFTLRAFSRNLRKEISKAVKIYFYDLGVRNSLIQNYNQLTIRNDIGALWENFLIIERLKKCQYGQIFANRYFWRTYDQKEIDYIEEQQGKLFAYEFKWGRGKSVLPGDFAASYPGSEFVLVNKDNYGDFISSPLDS